MTTNQKTTEVLNDLIQINNDRIVGYEKAANEAKKEPDLASLFNDLAAESRAYVSELQSYVEQNGKEAAEGTTIKGKIYRAWMSVKATFSGNDRKAVLESCEFGEDAAQKAYKEALAETDLTSEARSVITDQKSKLKKSHDKVKRLRDMQPA